MQKGLRIQGFQMCNVRVGSICLSLVHSAEVRGGACGQVGVWWQLAAGQDGRSHCTCGLGCWTGSCTWGHSHIGVTKIYPLAPLSDQDLPSFYFSPTLLLAKWQLTFEQ